MDDIDLNGIDTGFTKLSTAENTGMNAQDSADSSPTTESRTASGVAHRLQASRSVLSLAIGKDCVFAGLQGGDIVVSTTASIFRSSKLIQDRHGHFQLMSP